jgi:hypothetical protein
LYEACAVDHLTQIPSAVYACRQVVCDLAAAHVFHFNGVPGSLVGLCQQPTLPCQCLHRQQQMALLLSAKRLCLSHQHTDDRDVHLMKTAFKHQMLACMPYHMVEGMKAHEVVFIVQHTPSSNLCSFQV